MNLEALNKAKSEGWVIDHLRFTIFPSGPSPSPEDMSSWWEIANPGEEYQNRVEQKLPNGGLVISLEGPWAVNLELSTDIPQPNFRIVMRLAPSPKGDIKAERIDLLLLPSLPPPEEDFPRPPTLKDLSLISDFEKRMGEFLNEAPPAQRLAFGGVLLREGDSPQGVLRFLQEKLKTVRIDPEHTKDFVYRVNRPSNLFLHNWKIQINRIHEWSLSLFSTLVTSGPPSFTQSHEYVTPFARLLLDINTDATYAGTFERNEAKQVLRKLFAEGLNILAEGDFLVEGKDHG